MKDELNELSPFLAKLKKDKKEKTTIPNNYFENFEARLMNRIHEEEALNPKEIPTMEKPLGFWARMQFIFAPKFVAGFSMAVVFLVLGVLGLKYNANDNEQVLLAELTVEEAKNYILNNIEDFDTEDIISHLAIDEIVAFQENIPVLEKTNTATQKENKTSTIDKAIKSANAEDLLKDLTEDDLEEENFEDLF